jgi:hypothetical protein
MNIKSIIQNVIFIVKMRFILLRNNALKYAFFILRVYLFSTKVSNLRKKQVQDFMCFNN